MNAILKHIEGRLKDGDVNTHNVSKVVAIVRASYFDHHLFIIMVRSVTNRVYSFLN